LSSTLKSVRVAPLLIPRPLRLLGFALSVLLCLASDLVEFLLVPTPLFAKICDAKLRVVR